MKQIVTRLLTKRPKLEQNKTLKQIADCIGEYPEDDITLALDLRFQDSKKRLDEKNIKGGYVHERARKAYKSIRNKLQRCYIYLKFADL